jgi:hypothetical protein
MLTYLSYLATDIKYKFKNKILKVKILQIITKYLKKLYQSLLILKKVQNSHYKKHSFFQF